MPLYEYQCRACDHRFERIRKFSDQPLTECPACGGEVEKLFSSPAFQFKGSGFYITDYARKSEGAGSDKDGGSSKEGGASSESGSATKESSPSSSSESSSSKESSSADTKGSDKSPSKTSKASESKPAVAASGTKPKSD